MPNRSCRLKPLLLAVVLCLGAGLRDAAATEQEGALWLSARADGVLDRQADRPRWRWRVQGDYRGFDALEGTRQAVARAAVGRRLDRGFTLWAGYDLQVLNRDAGGSLREQRSWQRLEWTARTWPVATFRTRTQLEQRRFDARSGTGWRLRQRLRLDFPLEGVREPEWFVSVEPFFDLRDTDWTRSGLNQNRVQLGIAFDPTPATRAEIAYLHQWLRNPGGENLVNHVLVLNWRWRRL